MEKGETVGVGYEHATAESIRRTVASAIEQGDAILAEVEAVSGARTFADTIAPIDRVSTIRLDAYGSGPFLARCHPDPEVRGAAAAAEADLERWYQGIAFRRGLYEAVEAFVSTPAAAELDADEARLVEHLRRDLRRAGHGLAAEVRAELEDLNARLVDVEVKFLSNLDAHEDGIEVRREDLVGLPDSYIDRLAPGSVDGTYRVTLDYPDLLPFLDNAKRRDLREQLASKAANAARDVNRPLLDEAVNIRRRIASIFGLTSWADHRLEPKMARNRATVEEFYAGLVPALQAKAEEERADLLAYHDADRVERWDVRYLHTRVRRERYGLDDLEVASYFPAGPTLDGLFDLTAHVFGLTFTPVEDADVWHPDVTTWEMRDGESDELLAVFHLDLHPREGKFGHAAVFPIGGGYETPSGYAHPRCAMLANFTSPTADGPALLRHSEVVTLFHEFGHVLHSCLARTRFHRFSGTNVEPDFVEAPSQILEHWCWTPCVLQRFARHHETGQVIPEALVDKLVEARDLHVAVFTLRQVEFGLLDLALHGDGPFDDLEAIEAAALVDAGYLPVHPGTFFSTGWAHIMSGYDAGYYGYLWSKVFGDDMFSEFLDRELDPEVGMRYRRHVLERGGSADATVLLRDFLGREPNREAFLAGLGITA